MSDMPLVSICCITYNHSSFIRQCLDGFIMQKTNFPIEVLIHDDASTDGTADIIREYEQKYPDIIKPIYQTENQYSKGISISRTFNYPRVQGKYMALCEGDDYWIDEYKLQKQVDFMEANDDFSICFHNVKVYHENEGKFTDLYQVPESPEISDIKNLAVANYIHTPSVLYRNNDQTINNYNNFPVLVIGDYILHMLFAKHGKIKRIDEEMAVYRVHEGGAWSLKSNDYKTSKFLLALTELIHYYKIDQEICAILIEQYRNNSFQLFPSIHKIPLMHLIDELDELNKKYYRLLNSKSLRITKPLRLFYSYIKNNIKNNKIIYIFIKFFLLGFKKNINQRITSLNSFSKIIKKHGGVIFGEKILSKYSKNNNSKIIFLVSHELNLTGAPIALYYFSEYLKIKKEQPVFISTKDGALRKLLINNNIPVIVYKNIYNSEILLKSSSLYNLIVINTIVGIPLISFFNNTNIPILWWIHESSLSYPNNIKIPEYFNKNIHIYCGGHYAAEIFKKHIKYFNTKQLLYHIPDHTKISNDKKLIIKNKNNKCIFAIVGTLEERKGHDVLIKAIRLLNNEQIKNCLFIIVGKNHCKPSMYIINKLIKEYPKNIIYLKTLNRKKIISLYQQMDCLICSSKDDPMPVVVTEAMIFSKIIICSENTGSAKLINEMKSGFIYKDNSPEELSKLIDYVINNKNNLSQIKVQARKTYEKYFPRNVFDNSVELILDNIINKQIKQFDGIVSVIIPVYNGGQDLYNLIRLLKKQVGIKNIEIIIIDSESTDNSVELAESLGAIVIKITQAEFSHSYSRNLGAKKANGDYLLFMTQDALPTDDNWINNLMQPLLNNDVIAVSCMETPRPDSDLYARIKIWLNNKYLNLLDSDRILLLPKNLNIDNLHKNAQLNDVTCLINKKIFMQYLYKGNFAEDLDLGLRLIKSGYKLSLLSSVQVIHSHTRPAIYHLKRNIVDSITLKSLFINPKNIILNSKTVTSRIITSFFIIICLYKYLIKTNNKIENISLFMFRINYYFNKLIIKYKNISINDIIIKINKENILFDTDINLFIRKIISCCNYYTFDSLLITNQMNYFFQSTSEYIEYSNEIFNIYLKQEIINMLIKIFGQFTGSILADYYSSKTHDDDNLIKIINEYSKGI